MNEMEDYARKATQWKYISAICTLSDSTGPVHTKDLSEELEVSPASVTQMIKQLAEEGFLEYMPYKGVRLTEKGKREAKKIHERREVLMEFFELIGLNSEHSRTQAKRMESRISDESFLRLKDLVETNQIRPYTGSPSFSNGKKGRALGQRIETS